MHTCGKALLPAGAAPLGYNGDNNSSVPKVEAITDSASSPASKSRLGLMIDVPPPLERHRATLAALWGEYAALVLAISTVVIRRRKCMAFRGSGQGLGEKIIEMLQARLDGEARPSSLVLVMDEEPPRIRGV